MTGWVDDYITREVAPITMDDLAAWSRRWNGRIATRPVVLSPRTFDTMFHRRVEGDHITMMEIALDESRPQPEPEEIVCEPTPKGFDVWDGGVFCLACDDTPGCEGGRAMTERPAYTYKCPTCEKEYIVDDLALRMSEQDDAPGPPPETTFITLDEPWTF